MSTKSPDEIFASALMSTKEAETPPPPPAKAEAPAPGPRPLTQRSVFSHPDAHPVVLDFVLLKHFQLEWFSWLGDTIFEEISKTFNTSIAEVNKLKILAVQNLHCVDSFWNNWEVFEKVVCGLNGIVPRPDAIQPPDLPLLFAAIEMANNIRSETFSDEVARYCSAVFLNENVHYAPEPLSFCQDFISQPMYTCNECEKVASMLPPFDGFCSSCAGHYRTNTPFKMAADPELVAKGYGKDWTESLTYDPAPVKARFEELNKMKSPAGSIRETSEDIQAAKLITAVDFQNYRTQQLKEQLESIRGWLETA